jgi:hypothetical protein
MTSLKEAPYGQMAVSISGNAALDAQGRQHLEHAAIVLNRAADVFYAESGHDLRPEFQPTATHITLAAAALEMEMEGQGLNPASDSFPWTVYSAADEEMKALQDVLTAEEWQAIDDLARKRIAQRQIAQTLKRAIEESAMPLADFLPDELAPLLELI